MSKIQQLTSKQAKTLYNHYGVISSGATIVRNNYYPTEFSTLGYNKRDVNRNAFWGTIITKPNDDQLVFGFVYLDHRDNTTDEDIFLLDSIKLLLQQFPKGEYEKINPLYKGTHHGLKDFLRP